MPDTFTKTEPQEGRRPRLIAQWYRSLGSVRYLLLIPVMTLLITAFIMQPYVVSGQSMQTTLDNGDRLIVNKTGGTIAKITGNNFVPKRGDIVIFVLHSGLEATLQSTTGDTHLIKRVIGLPGERVVIDSGKVTVYNQNHPDGFDPDAGKQYIKDAGATGGRVDIVVEPDSIFVLGDNRGNSTDSRRIGTVKTSDITGTLVYRLFPLDKSQLF